MLLLAIFCFSVLFRAALIFHNNYPPSSDIGLHGSIINLILEEQTLPSWNPYHMGGEQLATPPGFHFFVSILILITGMPLTLAQLITATFFSSIIVFPAYLVSKRITKNPNAGLLAAFFAAISALSIEMISWGGYTNIVSLSLIITIFYLFLRDIDKPTKRHLLIGTLLFGTLIITHTFSLSVFLPILAVYLVLLIVGKLRKLKEMRILNMLRFFIVSASLGIVAVSPWILRVFNFYINATSEGALTGGLDNRNIILANRTVEPIILTLIVVLIPTFLILKDSRKRYVDKSSLLLIAWFIVPVIMTQAHVLGVYTDYSRFLYFIDFPGIIIISACLLYISRYTTVAINKFPKIRRKKIKKVFNIMAFTLIVFIFIIASLWSIFPHEAMIRTDFYTTIQQSETTALEWIKNNTPEYSVLVADHLYGWWLSGIAERPTLSAAGLEFLIYSHELEVAKNASLLLDTNYYIDNDLIQIRDDGPYRSRHEFSIEKESGESFRLLYFENNGAIIEYNQQNITLLDMKVTENSVSQNEDLVRLKTTYKNELFTLNKTLQVNLGEKFAELSFEIVSVQVDDFTVSFTLNTTGDIPLKTTIWNRSDDTDNSISTMIGTYNSFEKLDGQVIFTESTPSIQSIKNTTNYEITYHSQNSIVNATMLVGVFDLRNLIYSDDFNDFMKKYFEFDRSQTENVTSDQIITWRYSEMIKDYEVSYVVCRDQNVYMKFAKDPKFRLVFNCGNVAVFQVSK